jgi:hypothetical protein
MSSIHLQASQARALARFAKAAPARRPRADRGKSRLDARVQARLFELLSCEEHMGVTAAMKLVARDCRRWGLRPPSRATIYNFAACVPTAVHQVADLPAHVRRALYNLDAASLVPEAQIVFYCFNYGDLRAVSFAAGRSWLALYQAGRTRGWRPKSRGLFQAVLRARRK